MKFYYIFALGILCLSAPPRNNNLISAVGLDPVQVIPKYNYIYPEELGFSQLFQCVNNIPECQSGKCTIKWRVENNILKSTNTKYLAIDDDKALYIRAPLSRSRQRGPFACIVEKDGKALSQGYGYLRFLSITKGTSETAPAGGGTTNNKIDVIGAFKDGKNISLIIIIFICFFLSSLSWGLILYCKANLGQPTKDGYTLLEEQEDEEEDENESKKKEEDYDDVYDDAYGDVEKGKRKSSVEVANPPAGGKKTAKKAAAKPPVDDDYDDVYDENYSDVDDYDDVMQPDPKPIIPGKSNILGKPPMSLIKELSRISMNPPPGHDLKPQLSRNVAANHSGRDIDAQISRNMSSKHHRSKSKSRQSDDSGVTHSSSRRVPNSSSSRSQGSSGSRVHGKSTSSSSSKRSKSSR